MASVLQPGSGKRPIRRFLLFFAAWCCLTGNVWSDPEAETTQSLLDLDGEIQAIKSETLAISLELPGDGTPLRVENLEQLLARDPGQVSSLDYLRAIGLLERSMAGRPMDGDARLLLARLKLAYGLYLEAGYDLHGMNGEGVPGDKQELALYELAEAFYSKGYFDAALEALTRIPVNRPLVNSGQYQLLHANVLMSLGKNAEAARVLSPWRGGEALEAYGHYNLAVALLRIGEEAKSVAALEEAIDVRAESVETANLRDRARLSLGYLLARQGNYRGASRQLTAISDSGPFSDRAAVALGWIAHQQGRPDEAIASWVALQAGPAAAPDVLETLILVPALHRETEDLKKASIEYESAMTVYQRELDELDSVRHRLSRQDTVARLLEESEIQVDGQMKSLLGPLLASRQLVVMRRDRSDLHALLQALEQELRDVETEAGASPARVAPLPEVEVHRASPGGLTDPESAAGSRGGSLPGYIPETKSEPPGTVSETSPSPVDELPEIESPSLRQVKPFPDTGSGGHTVNKFTGLPQNAQWIKQPPDPRIFGIPDSQIIRLPSSGEFFHRPGESELEDYAYPDELPGGFSGGESRPLLPGSEADSSFEAGTRPVGHALRELALELDASGLGLSAEGEPFDPLAQGPERERQLAALRERILVLKERIKIVSGQYENHARKLALAELNRRQVLLENLQEQASLGLAKTYDRRGQ